MTTFLLILFSGPSCGLSLIEQNLLHSGSVPRGVLVWGECGEGGNSPGVGGVWRGWEQSWCRGNVGRVGIESCCTSVFLRS